MCVCWFEGVFFNTCIHDYKRLSALHSPFIIPLFAGLSVAGALTGSISAAVKTANERKAQMQAQKELEKQISGCGVIVDFAEKLERLPEKARLLVGNIFFYRTSRCKIN